MVTVKEPFLLQMISQTTFLFTGLSTYQFKAAELGHRLHLSIVDVIKKPLTIPHYINDFTVWCGNLCVRDDRCMSFNLGVLSSKVICQLSSATLAGNSASMVSDVDYTYYQLT